MQRSFRDPWVILVLCAAVASWLPFGNAALAAEPGLTVYRASKLDWQVRLASTDSAASFAGMFTFTKALVSHQPVSLEAADRVWQPASNKLGIQLNVWPRWDDGVDFTTAEFSGVCLRSTTAQQQVVYLSSPGQKERIRVTTPVDLTNTGACGIPKDPFPPPTRGRKFNPGHYVVLTDLDDEVSLAESIVPGVTGFVKRYAWRQLEPTRGNYDFSVIKADLDMAARYGLQLVAQIEDKSFSNELPTPAYLRDKTLPNASGGYTAVRWDPFVVQRYKNLLAALGSRFDWNPRFEGIATLESAHGLDQQAMQTTLYTPEKYREALVDVLGSAATSMPKSRVFWFMNFLWGGNYYMGEIARRLAPLGVVMGGPDVMPDNQVLQLQTYPFYDGAAGRMPLLGQVEPSCYHHPHADPNSPTKYWTPEELFHFARDELHVSYMFWARWRWRVNPEAYNWWDAMPAIESNTTFNL